MTRHAVALVLIFGLCNAAGRASADNGCFDYAKVDLVYTSLWALAGKPADWHVGIRISQGAETALAACSAILATSPEQADARLQFARAEIALGMFGDADRSLGLASLGSSEAPAVRMRGFLRDLGRLAGHREIEAAQDFYLRAIALGDAPAAALRAQSLAEMNPDGSVPAEAVELLDQAVAAGYPPAMDDLASIIERGLVPGRTAEDAARLARQAAEADWPTSKLRLGHYYDIGYGVPKDPVQANKWSRDGILIYFPVYQSRSLPDGFYTWPPP